MHVLIENKEKLRPIFLENSALIRTFRDKVEEIIDPVVDNTSLNLEIMGFVDNQFLNKLEKCAERVRIIRHSEQKVSRNVDTALKRLLNAGAEVRSNQQLHARLVLTNNNVIIGSGDLQADSLGGNRIDACIWSDHPEVISNSKLFFNRIWEESKPIGDTLLLNYNFEKDQVGSKPRDPWRVYEGEGKVCVTDEIHLKGQSNKCVKITSPYGSHSYMLFKFRDSKIIRLEYKIRHETFNDLGLGSGFNVFYTPPEFEQPVEEENQAVWMAIRNKKIQYFDTDYHIACDFKLQKWYNVSLTVDCKTKKYSFNIDGQAYKSAFRHPLDFVNTIKTASWKDKSEWTSYIDQVVLHKIE